MLLLLFWKKKKQEDVSKKVKIITGICYSREGWSLLYPDKISEYDIVNRDLNGIIVSCCNQAKNNGVKLNEDTMIEFVVLTPEYVQWLKENDKEHNGPSVIAYAESLSEKKRKELWHNANFQESFNQFFVVFYFHNLKVGHEYPMDVPNSVRLQYKDMVCEALELKDKDVYVGNYLVPNDAVINESLLFKTAAEESLINHIEIKKVKYETYKAAVSKEFLFLPILIKKTYDTPLISLYDHIDKDLTIDKFSKQVERFHHVEKVFAERYLKDRGLYLYPEERYYRCDKPVNFGELNTYLQRINT